MADKAAIVTGKPDWLTADFGAQAKDTASGIVYEQKTFPTGNNWHGVSKNGVSYEGEDPVTSKLMSSGSASGTFTIDDGDANGNEMDFFDDGSA